MVAVAVVVGIEGYMVDGLASDLDGPQVGVGKSFRRDNNVVEGTNPNQCFEVQCCWSGPGKGGDVIVTGVVTELMKGYVTVARDMIMIHEERITRDLGLRVRLNINGEPISLLRKTGQDLHVHIVAWSNIKHSGYIAAIVVAMVSLMSKRRLPEDLGAEGDLNCSGNLSPIRKWTPSQVAQCKRQGLRRMVVSVKTEYEEEAKEAAAALCDDGKATLEFLPFRNILDALPHIFGTGDDEAAGDESDG